LGAFDRQLERGFGRSRSFQPRDRFPQGIRLVRVVTSPHPLAYLLEELGRQRARLPFAQGVETFDELIQLLPQGNQVAIGPEADVP
jgi:hypothetical protein